MNCRTYMFVYLGLASPSLGPRPSHWWPTPRAGTVAPALVDEAVRAEVGRGGGGTRSRRRGGVRTRRRGRGEARPDGEAELGRDGCAGRSARMKGCGQADARLRRRRRKGRGEGMGGGRTPAPGEERPADLASSAIENDAICCSEERNEVRKGK